MEPLDFLLGALAVLVCVGIVYAMGLPRKPVHEPYPTFEQLDAKRVRMEIDQVSRENGWITIEQVRLESLRQKLDVLRATTPRTQEVTHKLAEIHSAIVQAEHFLGTLERRKEPFPGDRRKVGKV